jgi:hypothetical protein
MFRRPLLFLPVLLGAIALPAAPALAGEDDGDSGSARLYASQGCVFGERAKASVAGDDIDRVAFYVDGDRVKTVDEPNSSGRYAFSMACSGLSVGAHHASAVVRFEEGSHQTLRFQLTRARQTSPRFTG